MGEKGETKVTVQKSAKEKPSWQSAGILMKKKVTVKEQQEQKIIIALAMAFDIPPQGITILSDNPYINKQGLEYTFSKHKGNRGWSHFLATDVVIAEKAGDTAVFKTTAYNKEGKKIANGFGTANAGNVRMSTIKVFLNEIAETRSQNRCLRKICSPILYSNFIRNIMRLEPEQKELIAEAAVDFGSVTAEEVGAGEEEAKTETLVSEAEMVNIAEFLQEINNAKTQAALKKIGARVKIGIKVKKFNKAQTEVLKEAWLGKAKKLTFK